VVEQDALEDLDVLREEQLLEHVGRHGGERLVGRGEDGEGTLTAERLGQVGSGGRGEQGGERTRLAGDLDDGARLVHRLVGLGVLGRCLGGGGGLGALGALVVATGGSEERESGHGGHECASGLLHEG
jgi:hypothetical protein